MNTTQVLVSLLIAGILPFVAQFINDRAHLDGRQALVAAAVLTGLLSFVGLLLTGGLTLNDLTLQNFSTVFGTVFTLSQLEFQAVKDQLGWTSLSKTWNAVG